MRTGKLWARLVFLTAALCILLPAAFIVLWSFVGRWPWPSLKPESLSLRAVWELLSGNPPLPRLLFSSIILSGTVSLLGTAISLLAARAIAFYDIPCKRLLRFGFLLPLLIPGTAFSMGVQFTLLRLRLSDTLAGVVLVHLIAVLPYCFSIMADLTNAVGTELEDQAAVLGAPPLRAFLSCTLPALLPGILSAASMGFVISYSQYFSTLLAGGGRVQTIALVLVPYIQSGDRALASAYAVAFVGSALLVFALFEAFIRSTGRREHEA